VSKEDGILIFDEVSLMRHRISVLLQELRYQICEAASTMDVYHYLSNDNIDIRLVLMDIGFDAESGFEVIDKIKEKRPGIPILIITSNNKRQTFLRCISEGVTDYILKPFEDEFLVEKVTSILQQKEQEQEVPERFVFDIPNYLKAELRKAVKGNYGLTLIMCAIVQKEADGITSIERKYIQTVDDFYQKVKVDLWDTDVFERYGSNTFVGVFPYCNSNDADKIINKLTASYETLQNEYEHFSNLSMVIESITCPNEITDSKQLLLTLSAMLENKVDQIKTQNNEDL